MPGLDGTGPNGQGPMTGGGFGLCPGSRRRSGGRGMAYGCGGGRGRGMAYRRGYGAYTDAQDYIEQGGQYYDDNETAGSRSLEAELDETRKQNEILSAKVDELADAIKQLQDKKTKKPEKTK